ncbi:hypothetical protein EXE58_03095 [Nocardioides seonyuensis]|uniref:Uncharacterized protein n=1 Tax=Nocardioides seonyuensis TaxID=2518371 RepID=A0A4P7IBU7_9ACTN|nr:hypothetical protein [Nocardioides seonyuensis]QBX54555.1 hypothetical protein EXE58_03095 [Nocardioides seonyuensis]
MRKSQKAKALGVALSAVLVLPMAASSLPATAAVAPPTDHVWYDEPETTPPALDIVSVRRVAAAEPGRRMRVVIRFAERIEAGDSLEVHFSTDRDPDPEVWYAGMASSEYEVYDVDHWRDNDDPIGAMCSGRMRFALGEQRGLVTFDPQCLDDRVRAVRVNVQTFFYSAPHGREFAPARRAWLPRTAAYAG